MVYTIHGGGYHVGFGASIEGVLPEVPCHRINPYDPSNDACGDGFSYEIGGVSGLRQALPEGPQHSRPECTGPFLAGSWSGTEHRIEPILLYEQGLFREGVHGAVRSVPGAIRAFHQSM